MVPNIARVFDCQKCGQCCQGKGGIVVSPRDLARLCEFLGAEPAKVIAAWLEEVRGKLKIKSGADGYCVFFRHGAGCAVHPAKPSICQAWPFFRGNLEDPASLSMARDFCPGIARNVAFADFVATGLDWLRQMDLLASDPEREANALILKPQPEPGGPE